MATHPHTHTPTSIHIHPHPSTPIHTHPHPSTSIYIHPHPSTSTHIHPHPSTSKVLSISNVAFCISDTDSFAIVNKCSRDPNSTNCETITPNPHKLMIEKKKM